MRGMARERADDSILAAIPGPPSENLWRQDENFSCASRGQWPTCSIAGVSSTGSDTAVHAADAAFRRNLLCQAQFRVEARIRNLRAGNFDLIRINS